MLSICLFAKPFLVWSGWYVIRTGVVAMANLRSLKSLCCSVDHSIFIRFLGGWQRLEKLLMIVFGLYFLLFDEEQ